MVNACIDIFYIMNIVTINLFAATTQPFCKSEHVHRAFEKQLVAT